MFQMLKYNINHQEMMMMCVSAGDATSIARKKEENTHAEALIVDNGYVVVAQIQHFHIR